MSHILTANERANADKWCQHTAVYALEEVKELRATLEAKDAEILALHRNLAGERLRADQGWQRYESANSDRNQLRAERVA